MTNDDKGGNSAHRSRGSAHSEDFRKFNRESNR